MSFCEGCFEKQRRIDKLSAENIRLRQKLHYEEKKTRDGYFGSSTPSAKKLFKKNADEETKKKTGGRRFGHSGSGRHSISPDEADQTVYLEGPEKCPDCQGTLQKKSLRERTVTDCTRIRTVKIVYQCEKKWCPVCRKSVQAKPSVLPKCLYGNQLLSQAACMHYLEGVPMGRVESIFELSKSSLYKLFHLTAKYWHPAREKSIQTFRDEKVKHADETGWRTDGESGYAWIFCSPSHSIYEYTDTRSSSVPQRILGMEKLPGVLVVDRYAAYNKSPCALQYCYAHLLRKVEDLGKEFPEEKEVGNFVSVLVPFLAEAIHLRTMPWSEKMYLQKAVSLQKKILRTAKSPSKHPGIKEVQTLFLEKRDRLFHWVKDREIPADNNRAERELRPTVIARKVSFGSQSKHAAKTRSVLMSVLQTAKKRLKNKEIVVWFKTALDKISENPSTDTFKLIPLVPP